ncbi:hypothetical protein ABT224_19865 [Streptomyces sp. NPDC001584]|uniref:hypothetical protein n=1 Tax=Streptomyces sp. NPDC001584 TaxID=3154521 RepID=UPI00331B0DFF
MEATVTTNEDRAQEGRTALEHYERARAALGRTPNREEDVELALATAAHVGDQQNDAQITVASLRADRDEAVTVFLDLISNAFHDADGVVPPRMLIDTVLAEETMTPVDVTYTWSRLTPEARRHAAFLAAVGQAAAACHDVYVQDLLEEGRAVFEDEAEEERYKRLNSRRAGS